MPRMSCVAVVWLPLAGAVLGGRAAADEPPPRERVEVRSTAGPRTLDGTLVVEARDGGLLLELADQRYELVQPEHIVARQAIDAVAEEESPRELGRRILAELPAGFDVHVTKHYVVCFDTTRDYAVWCAALFERLHDTFATYWTNVGLDIRRPDRPLVVVIFADRRAYEAFNSLTERNRMVRSTWGWLGFRSIGVEHERPPRFGGHSTFSIITTANFAYRGILASSFKLLKLFPLVGFGLALISFLALIWFLVSAFAFGVPFPGFGTIACLIALLFGLLFLFLGILAEYIAMIFTEAHGRPLYVVRSRHGVGLPTGLDHGA